MLFVCIYHYIFYRGSTNVGTKVVEEIKHVGSSISHAFHRKSLPIQTVIKVEVIKLPVYSKNPQWNTYALSAIILVYFVTNEP